MTRERPANATSLSARLRNLCRDHDIPERRARRLLGVVIVGQLLAQTGVGVVKGASNLEVRVGTARTRVSSDLDTARRVSLEEFRDLLAEALRAGWEGFTGVVADRGPIDTPAPAAYQPYRLRVKLSYRGGSFTSLVMEVSPEEVGALDETEAITSQEAAGWCEALGLPAPAAVPTLPLAHQIAQKLHACTAPDSAPGSTIASTTWWTCRSRWTATPVTTPTSRPPPSGCSPTATATAGRRRSPPATGGPTATSRKRPGWRSSLTSTRRSPGPTTSWQGLTTPEPDDSFSGGPGRWAVSLGSRCGPDEQGG